MRSHAFLYFLWWFFGMMLYLPCGQLGDRITPIWIFIQDVLIKCCIFVSFIGETVSSWKGCGKKKRRKCTCLSHVSCKRLSIFYERISLFFIIHMPIFYCIPWRIKYSTICNQLNVSTSFCLIVMIYLFLLISFVDLYVVFIGLPMRRLLSSLQRFLLGILSNVNTWSLWVFW